jgi:putative AlgH/UPF0301 family transcriptional regulator
MRSGGDVDQALRPPDGLNLRVELRPRPPFPARLTRVLCLACAAAALLPVASPFARLGVPGVRLCRAAVDVRARRAPAAALRRGGCRVTRAGADVLANDDDDDWRRLRARLVAGERDGVGRFGRVSEAWAHDSDNLVEQGSLLLGGSSLEYGFGLRQQHFHKCVVLVLSETDDCTFGVVLNRPTSLRTASRWRIWFGGEVQGISAARNAQEAVCLHRSTSRAVADVSQEVVEGVFWCSLREAETCVALGHAAPEDFLSVVGYAGWDPAQLQKEIDARHSWHVAAASPALLGDILEQAAGAPTDDDGIGMWEALMARIGRQDEADKMAGSFEDRMLREWVRVCTRDTLSLAPATLDSLLQTARRRRGLKAQGPARVGTVLRASSCARHILERQFLHKSLLLVFRDTEDETLAVVLNRPSHKTLAVQGRRGVEERLVCFGGDHDAGPHWQSRGPFWSKAKRAIFMPGDDDAASPRVMWLTASPSIRAQGIGRVVVAGDPSSAGNGSTVALSWCSGLEAAEAMRNKIAVLEDFLLVRGFVCWSKQGEAGGLWDEITLGHFEELPGLPPQVWARLLALGDPSSYGASAWGAGAEEWEECCELAAAPRLSDENTEREALADEALDQFMEYFLTAS